MSADLVARLRAAAVPLTAEQWMGGDTQDEHYSDLCAEAADRIEALEAERDDLATGNRILRAIAQRIRAGWLPHVVGGAWWWGRPSGPDGFHLWSIGATPTTSVVERLSSTEATAWVATLHPSSSELGRTRTTNEETTDD